MQSGFVVDFEVRHVALHLLGLGVDVLKAAEKLLQNTPLSEERWPPP